jgi:hypothetical protein
VKLLTAVVAVCAVIVPATARAAGPTRLTPLADLEALAHRRTTATARVPLAQPTADVLRGVDSVEPANSGRVPNYLRALASVKPQTAKPFAHLLRTFAYGGHVSPALKLAMALRIAQVNRSPYAASHVSRLLHATGTDGDTLMGRSERTSSIHCRRATAWPSDGRNSRRWISTA